MVLSLVFFVGNDVLDDVFNAVVFKHCVFEYLSAVFATYALDYTTHHCFEFSACAPQLILGRVTS